MLNKIFQGDCLELMKDIPDGSIDFILTDLPYGITDCEWDKRIPFEPMWEQFKRITKENAAIALFANGKFLFELGNSNLKDYRYKIVVKKDRASGFLNAHKMPMKIHEDILIFYQQLPTYNPQYFYSEPYRRLHKAKNMSKVYRKFTKDSWTESDGKRFPLDTLEFIFPKVLWGNEENKFHSTQKPTDLLEYLIKTYTNEGETVLDATIGSGSTAVAAINTNRNFIGFELDEKYFEIAQQRIDKAFAEREQRFFNLSEEVTA